MAALLAAVIVISVGAAACGKKPALAAPAPPPPPPAAPATPPTPPPPPPPPAAPPAPAALSEDEIFKRSSLEELQKNLGDVYFDLDESTIRNDARGVLQKNADWMKRWTSTRITVEGHCDERGSTEYNLGLGDRRGAAVRDYLISLGIPGDRVVVVSKGKESPFCRESGEACWQQNRRGHFILTAK